MGQRGEQDLQDLITPLLTFEGIRSDISVREYPDGYQIDTKWFDADDKHVGSFLIDWRENKGHVQYLNLTLEPEWQKQGIYTSLLGTTPAFFRERGAKTAGCVISDGAWEVMRKGGWPDERGGIIDISDPNNRMEQYASWKRGEIGKPSWLEEG